MAEYIERAAAVKVVLRERKPTNSVAQNRMLSIIQRDMLTMPAADVAPVVRCKDCKYWGDEHGTAQRADGTLYARCRLHNHDIGDRHIGWVPTEKDFCSCGERKDGDTDGS